MKVQEFMLTEDYCYASGTAFSPDEYTLFKGAFIKPLELSYVPKHVIEDKRWKNFNKDTQKFCYTRLGIMPIPKELIGQV